MKNIALLVKNNTVTEGGGFIATDLAVAFLLSKHRFVCVFCVYCLDMLNAQKTKCEFALSITKFSMVK